MLGELHPFLDFSSAKAPLFFAAVILLGFLLARFFPQPGQLFTIKYMVGQIKWHAPFVLAFIASILIWSERPLSAIISFLGSYALGVVSMWLSVAFFNQLKVLETTSNQLIEVLDDAETKRLVQVHNERTKLLANGLDRASTSCVTVGLATPAAAYLFNLGDFRDKVPGAAVVLGTALFTLAATQLHLAARRVLGGLR